MTDSEGLKLLRMATMALKKMRLKNDFSFGHFERSSFFTVILNGAKRSEKSPCFQNSKISPLRCEMTVGRMK
ncbi:MAG: hypothetical protein IPH58_09600 [Sphingobacteriales bacterium]|nr:hypothetical protein [Sphingobacteriales bacterium]